MPSAPRQGPKRPNRGYPAAPLLKYTAYMKLLIGGMLEAALMFFLCGAGLFGLARYWSQRKESPE